MLNTFGRGVEAFKRGRGVEAFALLTLSRATSQFCTTRDLIEWARSQFCTISKIRRSSTRSSGSISLSGNARDIRCRLALCYLHTERVAYSPSRSVENAPFVHLGRSPRSLAVENATSYIADGRSVSHSIAILAQNKCRTIV